MSSHRATHEPSLRLLASGDLLLVPETVRVVLAGLPGCAAASVAVLREGSPLAVEASQLTVHWLTELQYRHASGPSWDATVANSTVAVEDVAAVAQDEAWAAVARAAGLTATLAIPVPTGDDTAAVLNVFSRNGPGWTWSAATTATWFAAYVGHCMRSAKPPGTG
jgi:hypothetical protein